MFTLSSLWMHPDGESMLVRGRHLRAFLVRVLGEQSGLDSGSSQLVALAHLRDSDAVLGVMARLVSMFAPGGSGPATADIGAKLPAIGQRLWAHREEILAFILAALRTFGLLK